MSIQSLMTDNVTVENPAFTFDNRGNKVKDWDNATIIPVKAWITQRSTEELQDLREGTKSDWIVFLLPEIPIDNLSRVRYGTLVFQVVGKPHNAKTPEGPHHLEVDLELVEG